nr:hypothetical protein [Tanacetum cinerariifolium]
TNQFARAVSFILGIIKRYMEQQMNEAVKIIKEQVKEKVKVQVSKILPKIEKTVNEKLEAEVLTRSSNSSKTSYDMAADLSEMELKKILIEKMKSNNLGLNVGGEEGQDAEDDDEELYRDVKINLEGRDVEMTDVHTTQEFEDTNVTLKSGIDSLFETIPWVDVQALTTVAPLTLTAPTLPSPTILTISQFARAVSFILGIIKRYMEQQMNEAVKTVNEKLEAEVLTRSSNSSKTSYDMAADLSEMELKKILIEKMKSNKSIYRSDEQRNLYKALVDAYECDKIILDTYRDTVTLKYIVMMRINMKNPPLDQTGGP